MGKKGTENTVETAVFASNTEKTIVSVNVGKPGDPFYKDGAPKPSDDIKSAVLLEGTGDGTVLLSSTILPCEEGWADKHIVTGKHAKLIKNSVPDLIEFLNGTLTFNNGTGMPQMAGSSMYAAADAGDENIFSISFRGRIQPCIVDSSGNSSGIDPTTNLRQNDISGAVITIGPDSGNIEITNITPGTYTLYVKNVYTEDFYLNIGLMGDEYAENLNYHGFIDAELLTYTLTLDLLSDDKVVLSQTLTPPTRLEANPFDSGGLKTMLTWEAGTDPDLIGYNIYSKQMAEPYLTLLGTTTAIFYETDHPWAENSSIETKIYAVSAIKTDGTESFLSEMVKNNDRDHDGLTDEEEVAYGTLIDNPDSDGDGLSDVSEYMRGTNPLLPDTDGDGYTDYEEIQAGSDPLDKNSIPSCKGDFDQDTDIDGSDLATYAAGGTTGVSLEEFANNFGKASCP